MITRSIIAVSLGDPCGIGPEVVAKALSSPCLTNSTQPLVIGSPSALQRALDLVRSSRVICQVADIAEIPQNDAIPVLGADEPSLNDLPYGQTCPEAGDAAVRWLKHAAELAIAGTVQAITTAPINKEAAYLAGCEHVGHQEIFQAMTGAPDVVTMLVTPGLRVVHLSTHHSLSQACGLVTRDNVLAKLRLTKEFFARHGIHDPRIGVSALNPHGGESGLIGDEETIAISPAVADAREEGISAAGPIPADTVFNKAIEGEFDVVLAMYHDQGHIPIKVHNWASSTTMNVGLPFLRTSVDHGTAFDIAGQGIADATGMIEAINVASAIVSTGRLPN